MATISRTTGVSGSDRNMIYYLFLLGFFAIFSTTISKNPVLPLFTQALGADNTVIGLIAAFSPLAGILFSFPVGVLSDNFGRRRLLIAAGVVFLIAPLLYLFITDPVWLIPVRFFHGTATAILGPVISAVIAERFPENKGAMLGQYASATLVNHGHWPNRRTRGDGDHYYFCGLCYRISCKFYPCSGSYNSFFCLSPEPGSINKGHG